MMGFGDDNFEVKWTIQHHSPDLCHSFAPFFALLRAELDAGFDQSTYNDKCILSK